MILLCIDDDPEDVELFRDAVKTINSTYVCLVAWNGKQGLDILSHLRPDFIFLDINMPLMGGKETLQTIRQDQRLEKVPVCVLSTTTNTDEINVYKKMGATECLIKPNTFEGLCNALRILFQS